MKLNRLFEDRDYGSQFVNQRELVRELEAKLENLEGQLRGAETPADLRDFESDKDPEGGAKYIKRAIVKVQRRLGAARYKLRELQELWELTRPKVGDD